MQSNLPFFTVIIPTYNRGKLINRAILSVIEQEFTNWELIIVDDGSTDSTSDVVAGFKDNRVRYFYQQNSERSAARNRGIELSQGTFICFLDSDDTWRSEHLSVLHKSVLSENCREGLFYTGVCWNFEDGTREDKIHPDCAGLNPVEYVILNQIGPSTQCIHSSILKNNRFRTDLKVNEDVELNTRIAASYPLFRIPVVTVDMLIHSENTTALFEEYISPQVMAMNIIFSNHVLKGKISRKFKKKIQLSFDSQYIMVWERLGEKKKLQKAIVTYLRRYPFDIKNKARIVTLLYSLPFGSGLKQLIKRLKKNKAST